MRIILSICLVLIPLISYSQESAEDYLMRSLGIDTPEEYFKRGRNEFEHGNYAKAIKYLSKANDKGSIDAAYLIGECLFSGLGIEKDLRRSFDFFLFAAERGQVDACAVLGTWYLNGIDLGNLIIEPDLDRGMQWMTKAAKRNHSDAQWNLGDCYYIKGDYETAFKWYKSSADLNNPIGITRVGVRLMDGDGVAKDLVLAEKYLLQAKQFGIDDIDFIIGKLYYRQKRYQDAVEIFKNYYEKDSTAARFLGSCYAAMATSDNDYASALKYWEIASESEEFLGMFYTALCYYSGLGCEKNYNKAAILFDKILSNLDTDENGNVTLSVDDPDVGVYGVSAKFLSTCFRYGRGVEQDIEYSDILQSFSEQAGIQEITIRQIISSIKND